MLKMHREEVSKIDAGLVSEELLSAAASSWDEAVELSEIYGVRNSQASLLAPTGTIGLMMDCDTTGIEPDLGLVKVKKLVGGGTMSIVNQTVPRALTALGYSKAEREAIVEYIDVEKTIIGAPHLKEEHLAVFACSMGDNAIHYIGHVKMMAAVQPFLSGAISKTVNMPEEVTVEDVEQLHIDAWKMGLKAVAIYRDNCKVAQPLSMAKKASDTKPTEVSLTDTASETVNDKFIVKGAVRRLLPRRRHGNTYKFHIADLKGFFTVSEYEDGTPGELFINVSKQGSTLSGLMDSFAISVSHGLQYGVPLKSYVKSLRGTSFAPSGMTDDPDIRTASSITDYIMRRLALDYLSFDDRLELGLAFLEDMPVDQTSLLGPTEVESEVIVQANAPEFKDSSLDQTTSVSNTANSDQAQGKTVATVVTNKKPSVVSVSSDTAPLCYNCGNQTQRAGSCYVCSSCGSTTGCS